ncbi:MAG: T9SS type A sorting domain-containing protein [Bacteroidota bacterium]|nr:T9SS type A sorting domain-containing protein [Bacteroidota bacterium]
MLVQLQNAFSFTISGTVSLDDVRNKPLYGGGNPITLMEIPTNQTCSLYSSSYPTKEILKFAKDIGYIKINKGAKLYITDGVLTSANNTADDMWYGIYVDGTSTAVQNTSLINTNTQGYLFMERVELKHVKRGSSSSATPNSICKGAITVNSGGIIRIYKSTLDDNEVGIHFEPYANSNISMVHYITFQNSNSFATDLTFNQAYKYTDRYVEIDQCVDIKMANDHFLYNTSYWSGSTYWAMGIYSLGSSFSCFGCDFNSLYYGIYSSSLGGTYGMHIDICTFTENDKGIYISSGAKERIYRSTFNYDRNNSPRKRAGIYVYLSQGIDIYGNTFNCNYLDAASHNSNLDQELLYSPSNPFFADINFGGLDPNPNTWAFTRKIYKNKHYNTGNFWNIGIMLVLDYQKLLIECNEYNDMAADWLVYSNNGTGSSDFVQGSSSFAAGNTFSNQEPVNADNWRYLNGNHQTGSPFSTTYDYYYYSRPGGRVNPAEVITGTSMGLGINSYTAAADNGCSDYNLDGPWNFLSKETVLLIALNKATNDKQVGDLLRQLVLYYQEYNEIGKAIDLMKKYNQNGVADFEITKLYIQQKNYADATEWLLTVKTSNEHAVMLKRYFNVVLGVLLDKRVYRQLTKKEIEELEKIYNTCTLAGVYANEVLNYGTGKNYPERNCISGSATGVSPTVNKKKLKIYPVPASEYFIVDNDAGLTTANISIFNIIGKKVLTQKLEANRMVNCQSLPSGIYTYSITSDTNTFSGSIQIVR